MHNRFLPALKIIGILLFAWMVWRIDRGQMVRSLREVRAGFLLLSFSLLLLFFALKALRWFLLLRIAGLRTPFGRAWRTYHIGNFLSMITPGGVGELGRAAYVRRDGVDAATAVAVTLVDRCFDVAAVLVLAIAALGILFGAWWFTLALPAAAAAGLFLRYAGRAGAARGSRPWLAFLLTLLSQPGTTGSLLLLTGLCWSVYCLWAAVLAHSLGFSVPLPPFLSAIILTGVLSLLPIAPSGLGTRDAALVALLGPFGVGAPQAVALSFLMFLSLVLGGSIGGWYWLRGTPPQDLSPRPGRPVQ